MTFTVNGKVSIDGSQPVDVDFTIDSGASKTIISTEVAKKLGVDVLAKVSMGTANGTAVVSLGVVMIQVKEKTVMQVIGILPGINLLGIATLAEMGFRFDAAKGTLYSVSDEDDCPICEEIGRLNWLICQTVAKIQATACEKCEDAPALMSFAQDVVNVVKKGEEPHDHDNFMSWYGRIRDAVEKRLQANRAGSTNSHLEEAVRPKNHFDKRSFRTICPTAPDNDCQHFSKEERKHEPQIVIGCPKGHWNAKREECKVGTQTHKILHPKSSSANSAERIYGCVSGSQIKKEGHRPGNCYAGHSGVAHKLVRFFPKHEVYVEPFAGLARAFRVCPNCKHAILNDLDCSVARALKEKLDNESREATIMCGKDYKSVIKQFDAPHTFFLLDPPWRKGIYKHDSIDMDEFIGMLRSIKGKFMVTLGLQYRGRFCREFNCTVIHSKHKVFGHTPKLLLVTNYDIHSERVMGVEDLAAPVSTSTHPAHIMPKEVRE